MVIFLVHLLLFKIQIRHNPFDLTNACVHQATTALTVSAISAQQADMALLMVRACLNVLAYQILDILHHQAPCRRQNTCAVSTHILLFIVVFLFVYFFFFFYFFWSFSLSLSLSLSLSVSSMLPLFSYIKNVGLLVGLLFFVTVFIFSLSLFSLLSLLFALCGPLSSLCSLWSSLFSLLSSLFRCGRLLLSSWQSNTNSSNYWILYDTRWNDLSKYKD